MNRISLSPAERNFRSRLAQLAHDNWLLRGTLSVRSRKCGKATCHCANGELHASLYLIQSHDGKPRQLCIPKPWEPRVRQAVNDYHALETLSTARFWKRWLAGDTISADTMGRVHAAMDVGQLRDGLHQIYCQWWDFPDLCSWPQVKAPPRASSPEAIKDGTSRPSC